ncbi:MAG: hypothetical protein NWE80_04445 [Candidatus Bathyarchaeota archaeon]|nr:hypothetical protein [Candidatus Bathyarchaeota archaeon]
MGFLKDVKTQKLKANFLKLNIMTETWNTPEWKRKSKEFLEGKKCVWCGSTKNLAPHHLKKFRGLAEYTKIVSKSIKEHFANGKNDDEKQHLNLEVKKKLKKSYSQRCPKCCRTVKARKTVKPKFKCYSCGFKTDKPKKRINPTYKRQKQFLFRKRFAEKHKAEIERKFSEAKEEAMKEYLSLKKVEPMCRKCHYAREKGMVLCKLCQKNYHYKKYEKCFDCFAKTSYGAKLIEARKDLFYDKSKTEAYSLYRHPWCDKTFEIERDCWEVEASLNMCCLEHCDIGPQDCEIAEKNWLTNANMK